MQRSAVAADEERGAVEQRAQLGERELAARQRRGARSRPRSSRARACRDYAAGGLLFGRSRRDQHAAARIAEASETASSTKCAAGQRRNGLPALTCTTISVGRRRRRRVSADRRRPSAAHRRRPAISIGKCRSIRRRDAERRQQIPLVLDRMPRPELPRARDARRVHPAAAGDLVAEALRRAAQPGEQRRARPAVKIDREVVAPRAKRRAEREVAEQAAQPRARGATIT